MKKSNLLMLIGVLFLLGVFFFPLWNITLEAPQYPKKLGMNIHINSIKDANPNDIQNINIMNHYVGMEKIPETLPEFELFPIVVIVMIIFGLLIAFKGNYKLFLAWFILMIILGVAGIYDFYLWEYKYGHKLDPKAIIKFTDENGDPMAYQPPLIGSKTILNFKAISVPHIGAYLMFFGMALTFVAYIFGKKENKNV